MEEDKDNIQFTEEMPEGLLTQIQLANLLKVSRRQIRYLEEQGLPTIYVGRLPRYEWKKVYDWLVGRKKQGRIRKVKIDEQTT